MWGSVFSSCLPRSAVLSIVDTPVLVSQELHCLAVIQTLRLEGSLNAPFFFHATYYISSQTGRRCSVMSLIPLSFFLQSPAPSSSLCPPLSPFNLSYRLFLEPTIYKEWLSLPL